MKKFPGCYTVKMAGFCQDKQSTCPHRNRSFVDGCERHECRRPDFRDAMRERTVKLVGEALAEADWGPK